MAGHSDVDNYAGFCVKIQRADTGSCQCAANELKPVLPDKIWALLKLVAENKETEARRAINELGVNMMSVQLTLAQEYQNTNRECKTRLG